MKFIKILLFCTISIFSNAQNWFPVGGGISFGYVELFPFEDKLFAGGFFTTIDGIPARSIAYWDNKNWKSFILDSLPYTQIQSFSIYNQELYAYGTHSLALPYGSILKYDKIANKWVNLPNSKISLGSFGDLKKGTINKAIEFQNELYIAGRFDYIDDKPIENIAKWDGNEWTQVSINLESELQFKEIISLEIFNDELILTATFEHDDNRLEYIIASWDGETCSNIDDELMPLDFSIIYDLETFQGSLYAVGYKLKISGDNQTYAFIKWDGKNWYGIKDLESSDMTLTSLKKFSSHLAIGGRIYNFQESSTKGLTYLYNGNTIKKIEGEFSQSIRNFAEFDKQLFVGTVINTVDTISNDVGIFKLGNINSAQEINPTCKFFPNPTEGEFMINYKALENTSTIIRFHTLSGILVHEEIFNDLKGDYLRRFNLENFTTGIYVVQIQSKGINESKIFMKN